jgi:hypothetical protein
MFTAHIKFNLKNIGKMIKPHCNKHRQLNTSITGNGKVAGEAEV